VTRANALVIAAACLCGGPWACAKSSLKSPYDDVQLRPGSEGTGNAASSGSTGRGGTAAGQAGGSAVAGAAGDGEVTRPPPGGSGSHPGEAGEGSGRGGRGGASADAGGSGASGATPTRPDLPDEPPWQLPVPAPMLGEPGWRDSATTLCTEQSGYAQAQSVWSDSRGVFLIAITDGDDAVDPGCMSCPNEAMYFHAGDGWTRLAVSGASLGGRTALAGIAQGALILYGDATTFPMATPCGLAMVEGGTRSCEPIDSVRDVAVVDDQLAYALLEGELLSYDGTSWGPLPQLPPAGSDLTTIWANDSVLMATDRFAGRIASLRAGTWSIENTRTTDTFSAIWGNSATDVWAGSYQGTLHRLTGSDWREVPWSGSSCPDPTIYGMWGTGDTLYFHTSTTLARWNGSALEVLLEMPCNHADDEPRITSIWGNAEDELFVAVSDPRASARRCGSVFVLHFDGTLFHEM
jgi:hypothetical protein